MIRMINESQMMFVSNPECVDPKWRSLLPIVDFDEKSRKLKESKKPPNRLWNMKNIIIYGQIITNQSTQNNQTK